MAGAPLVEWSLRVCRAAESVGSIVIAAPLGYEQQLGRGGTGAVESVGLEVVEGGATRAHSVSNALRAVETELVAVHDAARPLLTPGLLDEVVALLDSDPEADAAIAAAPVTDTVKRTAPVDPTQGSPGYGEESPVRAERVKDFDPHRVENPSHEVRETLDRRSLWAVQTPQAFRTEALRRAIEAAGPDGLESATDDAMLIERAGGRVLIHPSSPDNIKVTTPADLRLAELLIAERGR